MLPLLCCKPTTFPVPNEVKFTNVTYRALYAVQFLLAVYSIIFSPLPPAKDFDSEKSAGKSRATEAPEREWEMVRIPETPGTTGGIKSPLNPMTPRTTAFHALGGAEGEQTPSGAQPPLPSWGLRREGKMPWSKG
jgi:hypothetical protein